MSSVSLRTLLCLSERIIFEGGQQIMNAKPIIPSIIIIAIVSIFIQGCFKDIVGPVIEDVIATLTTNKKVYNVGEEIEMTIVIWNRSNDIVNLLFKNGQTYDFIVKKMPENKEVWRWSEGHFFTEAIWTMTLDPKERKAYVIKWDQKDNNSKPIEPGTYKIEAMITSDPEIFSNSTRIRIEGNKQVLKLDTIAIGTQSGYHKRDSIVIKDEKEWERIWSLHTSNLDQIPNVPKVNFETEMVIAVFRGEFPSSGFETEITNVIEFSDKIVVTVTETNHLGGMLLDVMTYPFHIAKIKRSELPVEFVYKTVIRK